MIRLRWPIGSPARVSDVVLVVSFRLYEVYGLSLLAYAVLGPDVSLWLRVAVACCASALLDVTYALWRRRRRVRRV